jgi:catechol-2,3-dioxygenase
MILKRYHHFHSLIEYESNIIDQRVNDNYNLDIFEIIARTNERTKKTSQKKALDV